MRREIFTIAAATILFACSKNNSTEDPQVLGDSGTRNSTAKVSNWETVDNWSESVRDNNNGMKVFYSTRSNSEITPEVMSKGAVVVYSKGYNFSPMTLDETPMPMPWYYYIPWERMAHPYHYDIDVKDGQTTVSVKMHPDLERDYMNYRQNLAFRTFVLPEGFLKKHNLSQEAVKTYPYRQLAQMAGVTP